MLPGRWAEGKQNGNKDGSHLELFAPINKPIVRGGSNQGCDKYSNIMGK